MRWLKHNKWLFPKSFLIETKVCRKPLKSNPIKMSAYNKRAFPFSDLSEKEERLLLKAKNSSILATNSDISMLGTICDGYCVSGGGYIFIQWVRRGNKEFYAIDIEDFITHRNKSKRKSLTETEAKQISYLVGHLV